MTSAKIPPSAPLAGPPADALASLFATLRAEAGAGARRLPPVERWNPDHCGDIGMEIRADGSWWHEGRRIGRQALVDLFSTVLRKDEDGQTYLVTPGEKIIVHVGDAHFLGVRADRVGEGREQTVVITTNGGDAVTLGHDHALDVRVDPATGEPRPYVGVRGRLIARILRPAFYDMVEWAEETADGRLTLWSQGIPHDLGSLA
jgi:uncharacterized protein